MMKTIDLRIITPASLILHKSQVSSVTVPTTDGDIAIYPNHMPLVSVVREGYVRVGDNDDGSVSVYVNSGILRVTQSTVDILVDSVQDKAPKK